MTNNKESVVMYIYSKGNLLNSLCFEQSAKKRNRNEDEAGAMKQMKEIHDHIMIEQERKSKEADPHYIGSICLNYGFWYYWNTTCLSVCLSIWFLVLLVDSFWQDGMEDRGHGQSTDEST